MDHEQRRKRINKWHVLAQRYLAFPFWERLREQTIHFNEREKQRFYHTLIVYLAAAAGLEPDQLTEVISQARDATIELATGETLADSFLPDAACASSAPDHHSLAGSVRYEPKEEGEDEPPKRNIAEVDRQEPSASGPAIPCIESLPPELPRKGNEPDVAQDAAQPTIQSASGRICASITKPILLAGHCESFHKETEEFVERIQHKFNIAPNSHDDIRTLQKNQAARGYVRAQLSPTLRGWSVRDSSDLSSREVIVLGCKTRTEAIEAGKRWVAEAPDRRELIAWPCDMELPEKNPTAILRS